MQNRILQESIASLVDRFPTNRALNVLFARMHDEAADQRYKAVRALRDFIAAKQQASEGDDPNVAAAYWNIANYCEYEFVRTKHERCRAESLTALQEAIRRCPHTYRSKFANDPDFEQMRKTLGGQQLLKESGSRRFSAA